MTDDPELVIDASVFIEAARRYYAFDLAPGFWHQLVQHADDGRIVSIDRVQRELKRGQDELAQWADSGFSHAFASTDLPDVHRTYSDIMAWVYAQDQFFEAAKAEFARGADGWVIAYALANGSTVVTEEVPRPNVRRKVPIPNVCQAFRVSFLDTFDMLRELGTRL